MKDSRLLPRVPTLHSEDITFTPRHWSNFQMCSYKWKYSIPCLWQTMSHRLYIRQLDQTAYRGLLSSMYARDVIRSTEWLDARRKWNLYSISLWIVTSYFEFAYWVLRCFNMKTARFWRISYIKVWGNNFFYNVVVKKWFISFLTSAWSRFPNCDVTKYWLKINAVESWQF